MSNIGKGKGKGNGKKELKLSSVGGKGGTPLRLVPALSTTFVGPPLTAKISHFLYVFKSKFPTFTTLFYFFTFGRGGGKE